jgi:hypothetical protein
MYALAHQLVLWAAGPGTYLFVAIMLVGGFSGTAVGDPIPALEGVALAMAGHFLSDYAIAAAPTLQVAISAVLLFWTATFIGMQLRCLFAPPGFHFMSWSPIQIWQRS